VEYFDIKKWLLHFSLMRQPLFLPGSGEWKENPENQRAAQNQLTVKQQ
jgi:hypothetical protein